MYANFQSILNLNVLYVDIRVKSAVRFFSFSLFLLLLSHQSRIWIVVNKVIRGRLAAALVVESEPRYVVLFLPRLCYRIVSSISLGEIEYSASMCLSASLAWATADCLRIMILSDPVWRFSLSQKRGRLCYDFKHFPDKRFQPSDFHHKSWLRLSREALKGRQKREKL